MSNNPPKVDEIFDEAVRRAPGEERERYLAAACRDDTELKQRVERLLRAVAEAGRFLESPAQDPSPTLNQPITEKPGTQIGPFKLLQQLGEGGMGVVYMAEQKEPFKRRVALKIIKPGMDTRQVIARFEAERQALAMMDHPNIAKVLDAGATKSGRPYFVMELVNGLPVTKYCDQQHLNPKERLELFVPICQAVQHAHQKGIIHRDLKPSNILVALYDGQAVPKIIDFGVAKATNQTLTEKTMFTQLGQVVGTLEYMSPEQAQRNQLDIDTRSDIYSLGVVLYELLTGETPFDRGRLRSAAFDEVLRIIREEEPSKPSTRLSSGQIPPRVATHRRTELKKLSLLIRGELDWIVMKALAKNRARRYETAEAMGSDLLRYLANEPVHACPPSTWYLLNKFSKRHKAALVSAAALAATLLLGIAGTSFQAWRASKSEKESQLLAALAEQEATKSQEISQFLLHDLLKQASPEHQPDPKLSLKTVLDRAARRLDGKFQKHPLVEAELRSTIGRTYWSIGAYPSSEAQFQRELELRQSHQGPAHQDTISALNNLGIARQRQGKIREAELLFRDALDKSGTHTSGKSSLLISCLVNLAFALSSQADGVEAEQYSRQALSLAQGNPSVGQATILRIRHALGNSLLAQGRYDEAEKIHRELLSSHRQVGDTQHPSVLELMDNLAVILSATGQTTEAEALFRQVREQRRTRLGEQHPDVLNTEFNLANLLRRQNRFAEAQEKYTQILDALDTAPDNIRYPQSLKLDSQSNLAICLFRLGDSVKAESLHREVWQQRLQHLGPKAEGTLDAMLNLAGVLAALHRLDEAEEIHREAIRIREKVQGPNDSRTMLHLREYVNVIWDQGRLDEAEQRLRDLCDRYNKSTQQASSEYLETRENLAILLAQRNQEAEAAEIFRDVVRLRHDYNSGIDPATMRSLANLIRVEVNLKNFSQAINLGRELVTMQQAAFGHQNRQAVGSQIHLAELYRRWGHDLRRSDPDRALDCYRAGVKILKQLEQIVPNDQTIAEKSEKFFQLINQLDPQEKPHDEESPHD